MTSQNSCPWCGSRSQFTDPWGSCTKCKIPWDKEKWMPGWHDVEHAKWVATHGSYNPEK